MLINALFVKVDHAHSVHPVITIFELTKYLFAEEEPNFPYQTTFDSDK